MPTVNINIPDTMHTTFKRAAEADRRSLRMYLLMQLEVVAKSLEINAHSPPRNIEMEKILADAFGPNAPNKPFTRTAEEREEIAAYHASVGGPSGFGPPDESSLPSLSPYGLPKPGPRG
jgi:hypothetical protein